VLRSTPPLVFGTVFELIRPIKEIARPDYAVSAGLMGHGHLSLSSFLNTHVAQFVCVVLRQVQVNTCQDDEQNDHYTCDNVHGCLLSYKNLHSSRKDIAGERRSPFQ
jgi:hypothetical protein